MRHDATSRDLLTTRLAFFSFLALPGDVRMILQYTSCKYRRCGLFVCIFCSIGDVGMFFAFVAVYKSCTSLSDDVRVILQYVSCATIIDLGVNGIACTYDTYISYLFSLRRSF